MYVSLASRFLAVSSLASQDALPPCLHGDFWVVCFYFCSGWECSCFVFFLSWLLFRSTHKERETGIHSAAVKQTGPGSTRKWESPQVRNVTEFMVWVCTEKSYRTWRAGDTSWVKPVTMLPCRIISCFFDSWSSWTSLVHTLHIPHCII